MIKKLDCAIRELADISDNLSDLLNRHYIGEDVDGEVEYQASRLVNLSESFNDLLSRRKTDYCVNSPIELTVPYESIRSRYCN